MIVAESVIFILDYLLCGHSVAFEKKIACVRAPPKKIWDPFDYGMSAVHAMKIWLETHKANTPENSAIFSADFEKYLVQELSNFGACYERGFPQETLDKVAVLCVCYLENHVFLGTRIDRKISARHVFYRRVLPAHLFRAR